MSQDIPSRPRGAQSGNANALKHGRYVKPKLPDLDPDAPLPVPALQHEIDSLRITLRGAASVFMLVKDMGTAIGLSRSIAAMSAALVELIKLQRWLLSDNSIAARSINKSILESPPRLQKYFPRSKRPGEE